MSKLLIVSDSHGLSLELKQIYDRHFHDVDLMIHCGDSELQSSDTILDGYVVVKGNCDFYDTFPEETIQVLGNKTILATHGHLYNVKSNLMSLYYRAQEVKADIVCFGHSHLLGAEMISGILFINPGSIRLPRLRKEKTYCILEINSDKIVVSVYDINLGLLADLQQEFAVST